MKLIVGLGNVGKEYDNTRHNIGFDAVDSIANKYNININREKFKGRYGEGIINGEKVLLIKPSTFMNLSGECVAGFSNFYKVENENIIIIYDDVSLDVGRIRLRAKGSAGGHNGIKSIISQLGTDVFPRVKIGVGAPNGNLVSHVLGKFPKGDREILDKVCSIVVEATHDLIKNDLQDVGNKYNGVQVTE